jgi:hypothetical protein
MLVFLKKIQAEKKSCVYRWKGPDLSLESKFRKN